MTDTNTSGADVLAKMDRQHDFFIRAGRYNGREGCWFNSGEEETVKSEYACIRTAVAALIEREAALIADRDAARRERDEEAEERERAELELAYLANEMIYEGNSIGWIASKAKNYGNALIEAWAALNDGGYRRPAGEMPNLTEAIKQHCDALASEVKALREDAERYRWLRNDSNFANRHAPAVVSCPLDDSLKSILCDSALDGAIDAARASAATGGGNV